MEVNQSNVKDSTVKKFQIAVVEDDRAFAAELEEFLGASGYTVAVYETSQKFLAALRQSECDLLIVDWSIPDLSGDRSAGVCSEISP